MNLIKEIESMPEFDIIQSIKLLNHNVDIFNVNTVELLEVVRFGTNENNHFHLFGMINRKKLEWYQLEICRLLHNFIASSYSLKEAVDAFVKRYKKIDSNFHQEYLQERDKLKNIPVYEFVYGLRIYIQHIKIPNIINETNWTSDTNELNQKVLLEKKPFYNFKRLTEAGKKYLDSFETNINIETMIVDYYSTIQKFINWIFHELQQIHQYDLSRLNSKKKEFKQIMIPQLLVADILLFEQNKNFENNFLSSVPIEVYTEIHAKFNSKEEKTNAFLEYIEKDVVLNTDLKIKLVETYSKQ